MSTAASSDSNTVMLLSLLTEIVPLGPTVLRGGRLAFYSKARVDVGFDDLLLDVLIIGTVVSETSVFGYTVTVSYPNRDLSLKSR